MYKWFYFGVIVVSLVFSGILVANIISYGRTDAWLTRAKDAGNPTQVSEFLGEYKTSLVEQDLVDGKYYTLWKYPATDMNTYIRIIDGLTERANALSRQSALDESYQMGLINLEKDLGDIDARAFSVWFASGGFVVVIPVVILGAWSLLGWVPLLVLRDLPC